MSRKDFSEKTKAIIAKRSGYRCAFPGCDCLLVGPGEPCTEIGECAHIYSASSRGPRGQAHLSKEDLESHYNGIYLCRTHHKIIDSPSGKGKYTADLLLQYKSIHEQNIAYQIGEASSPVSWIKHIMVQKSPNIHHGKEINLGRTTILHGTNGSGKSTIIEYLYSLLSGKVLERWADKSIHLSLDFSNPIQKTVLSKIEYGRCSYSVDDKQIPNFPYPFDVIYVGDGCRYSTCRDDVEYLSKMLLSDRDLIKSMVDTIDLSQALFMSAAKLHYNRRKPYEVCNIQIKKKDDSRQDHFWRFGQLSTTEKASVIFDLIIGYLRTISNFRSSILLIDNELVYHFTDDLFSTYLQQFQENSNLFQTIIASHKIWGDLKWSGWSSVELSLNDIKPFGQDDLP